MGRRGAGGDVLGVLNVDQRFEIFDSISLADKLRNTYAGKHMGEQLIRSGTSSALNYGEAQSAESGKDFIHKLRVVLKELRESINCLKIIHISNLSKEPEIVPVLINECNELISIFVKSIKTAKSNMTIK